MSFSFKKMSSSVPFGNSNSVNKKEAFVVFQIAMLKIAHLVYFLAYIVFRKIILFSINVKRF